MEKLTIMIPHNKSPHLHDLMTVQCKKICKELSKKRNLKIVWVMFPAVPPIKKTHFKIEDQEIVYSDKYSNILEIFDSINPDLVLLNGTLDFHNVNTILVSKFKKIPTAVLFFRNISVVELGSPLDTIKMRLRDLILEKRNDSSGIPLKQSWALKFYFGQFRSLLYTLKKTQFKRIQLINFVLLYLKLIFFTSFQIHKIICGDINLCTGEKWKKKLLESGFKKSSIFVVGDPFYDSLFLEVVGQNKQIVNKSNKIRILFCSSPRHEHSLCSKKNEFEMIVNVINTMLCQKDFEIALKLHPSSSSMKEYEDEVMGKISTQIPFYQTEDLSKLLQEFDLLLTYGGTGAIHNAVFFGKPIVNLDFDVSLTGDVLYFDDKIITQCKNLDSLISDIMEAKNKVISRKDIDQYFDRYVGIFDGNSSERTSNTIYKYIEKINSNKKL